MIHRLYLKNFRGIAEGDIQKFTQINLFVGPNNSGKTTILEALYLAATADREASVLETDYRAVYLAAEKDMLGLHPMSRVWQRHNIPPSWDATRAVWKDGMITLPKLPKPLDKLGSLALSDPRGFEEGEEKRIALLRVCPEMVKTDTEEEKLSVPSFIENYFGEKAEPLDNRHFCVVWHPLFTYNFNGVGGWFVEGDLPPANNTLLHDFHTTSDNLMFDLIERGYSDTDGFLRRIGQQLKEVFHLANEPYVAFEVIQDQRRRRGSVEQNQRMLPVDLWGDGMRHTMKVITPLLILHDEASKGKPGLMLWEDPELFMNPQTLRSLIRYIAGSIQGKPIQLFITTQSIEVIAYLTEMLRDGKLPKENVKAFRLKLHEGKQRVAQFDHSSLITWLELGMDPRHWDTDESSLSYRLGESE